MMIKVTHLNGGTFYINADQIEKCEMIPDTVVFMCSGNRIVVQEPPEELVARTIEYKRQIFGVNAEDYV